MKFIDILNEGDVVQFKQRPDNSEPVDAQQFDDQRRQQKRANAKTYSKLEHAVAATIDQLVENQGMEYDEAYNQVADRLEHLAKNLRLST